MNKKKREGAVAVEFALIAPVMLLLTLGLCEIGQALAGATKVASAVREGGRLASMDFSGKLKTGQTANEKISQDILNFLAVTGVRTQNAVIEITHAEGALEGTEFDLAAEENYLSLFRIEVSVPYANVSASPVNLLGNRFLTAQIVFRRGRTPINYEN